MAEHAHDFACTMKHYDTKDLIVREDIIARAKQLAELISTSEEVQTYQKAEKMIQENARIQQLISAIKKKQKEVVAFESFQNQEMVKKIEGEMKELQDELDEIPLVQQFQQSQMDINYLLQLVVSIIKDTVSQKINVEAGSDLPPTSCSD
jgi:cell fate (sporulation/competence/biofilm development) regulator YmcA (YheA/YmcA/DUF963 family)